MRTVASKEHHEECEQPDRGLEKMLIRGYETKGHAMLWLIGAVTLALVGMGATWGTVGTAVILFTAVAWMLLVFRPVEAGALVANLARRRFE